MSSLHGLLIPPKNQVYLQMAAAFIFKFAWGLQESSKAGFFSIGRMGGMVAAIYLFCRKK
jgi:hypothetical protein